MRAADRHAAIDELAAMIAEYIDQHADALGPATCTLHDDLDECDPDCTITPIGDVFSRTVEGFILRVGYARDTDHGHYLFDVAPPRQSMLTTAGLVATLTADY